MGLKNIFIIRFTSLFIVASMLVGSSLTAQTLTKKQQDSAFLLHPSQERLRNIKKSLAKKFIKIKHY